MKLDITLRTRLILLVVAAIFPLFVLAFLGAFLTTDEAVRRAGDNLEFSASLVASNQERSADAARQLLTAIANTAEAVDGREPGCQNYLRTLQAQLSYYANLGVIGPDGFIRCDAMSERPGGFAGDRDYFRAAVASRDFVNGGFVLGRLTGKPLVTFALPVLDARGQVTAVVFAAVYLTELSRRLVNGSLPSGEHLVITDRQGIVLASYPEKNEVVGKPVSSPTLQAAIKSGAKGVTEGPDASGKARIYAFLPSTTSLEAPFFVAASAELSEVVAPAWQRLMLVLLALVLVAALGSGLAWMLGSRIISRAEQILQASSQAQEGRLYVRIPVEQSQPKDELNRMVQGFNQMAESLEQRDRALEAELQKTRISQQKLLDAQRLGRIGHWEFDVASQYLSWSDELHELFGLLPGTFDGRHESFVRYIHPDDQARYLREREAAVKDGVEFEIEYRIINPAGEVRWLHQLGKSSFDAQGKTISRSGVVQDITVRKESELALARSNELLLRTGELAKVGGWEIGFFDDHIEGYWSEEVYRIHEVDPVQGLGAREALDFYAPEVQVEFRKALRAAIEDGHPWDMELPFITAKGRRIWVRTQGRAVFEGSKPVRLTGALQDITVQHQASEHLRLLETAISRLNDIVLITEAEPQDEPGPRIVFANEAFEHRTGYSLEEVMGKSPRFLQGPKTQRAELDRIREAMRKWQPVRAEVINYTKDGREFWLELDIVPIAGVKGWFTHWVAVERDITERKLAEQALLDSEHRYTSLYTTAPVPMWVFDTETYRFLTVNEAACRSYGYTEQEFLSMTIFEIRPEEERHNLRQQQATHPTVFKDRWVHMRKDGSTFVSRPFSTAVQYGGRPARFVLAMDMTSQVESEKAVQDQLAAMQRATDAAQSIAWYQTLDGISQEVADQARLVIGAHQAVVSLTSGNDWAQAITALSLSEKYARFRGLVDPPDGSGIYGAVCENNRTMRLTQAELEAHPRWRGFGYYADKHPPMRGWLAVPLTSRNGKNMGLLQLSDKFEGEFTQQDEYMAIELAQFASSAMENVQLLEQVGQLNAGLEQKVTERTVALARQEALFRALADQAPQVVWTADPNGMITYVNDTWLKLVGGQQGDWMGLRPLAVIHPQDVPVTKLDWRAASASRVPFAGTRRVRDLQGIYHTMSYRASPVLDEAGQVSFWVGIDADITEIKAIETALRLSNQELEAFSYSVSHDLRSPLNTIDGFSRLLSKYVKDDSSEKVRHYLSRIQAGVAQMGQLIEDLLALAQVSRTQLRHELVDISSLARNILDEWCARDPSREVHIEVADGLQAFCDEGLLKVVMENLLGNAWKFTSRQVESRAKAEITVGQTSDTAGLPVFFVRDNGAGFDMAYADKLFTAFQRLHEPGAFPGTGVGLATASRVISRHGGQIWADAVPGRGATFFFTLPRQAAIV